MCHNTYRVDNNCFRIIFRINLFISILWSCFFSNNVDLQIKIDYIFTSRCNTCVSQGNSQDLVSDCWRGSEFLELLNINNVGRSRFPTVLYASKLAIANFEKAKEEMIKPYNMPTISRETKKILEHLCFAMQMIMSDSAANDYRAYVVESMEPRKTVSIEVYYFYVAITEALISIR